MLHRVEGIVIRSMDYGEANKIITLCTKSIGKVGVFVRGAKKVCSRHAAATQLFTFGEYVFFRQMGALGTLTTCEKIETYATLRTQLQLTAYACYVAELVDKALHNEEAGGALFDQLLAYLRALDVGKDAQAITCLFEMKLLQRSGVAPALHACVVCRRETDLDGFSWQLGGAICQTCKQGEYGHFITDRLILVLLQRFERTDLRSLGHITLKLETKQQLKACLRPYIDLYVGIRLKSLSFLEQMEKDDVVTLDE